MTAAGWIATTRCFRSNATPPARSVRSRTWRRSGRSVFAGEALPSIASVSRFRLTSREPDAVAGTEIVVNGGKIDIVRDGGEAPGTQVEVRSLFYNVPARRKFLRAENTESRNIEHQLHLQAIGHPQVAFTFARDDRLVFQLPIAATLERSGSRSSRQRFTGTASAAQRIRAHRKCESAG